MFERKYIGEQVFADSNEKYDENDKLGNLIKGTLIAASGVALYKSGALKNIIKPILEVGNNFAATNGEELSSIMGAVKSWARAEEVRVPDRYGSFPNLSNSIFRKDAAQNTLKAIVADAKSGSTRFSQLRSILSDTTTDVKVLQKMIEDNKVYNRESLGKYYNTDLMSTIREIGSGFRTIEENETDFQNPLKRKAIKEFLELNTVTDKNIENDLKRTGYRKLRLDDLVDYNNTTGKYIQKEGAKVNLVDAGEDNKGVGSTLDYIERFFKRNNIDWEDAKGLGLDSGIRVDDIGNVIDYRMSERSLNAFKKSLVVDFKLPFVQFNPIQVLRPNWARAGERNNFIGVLSHEQIDPGITRLTGRRTIGEALAERFGEAYKDANVTVINGKGYIKDLETGGLQMIEDNLKMFRITNAEAIGINSKLNAQRQVAQLGMRELEDLTEDQIAKLSSRERIAYKVGKFLDMGYQEGQVRNMIMSDEKFAFDSASNIDELINEGIRKATSNKYFRTTRFGLSNKEYIENKGYDTEYNFKTVFGKGFDPIYNQERQELFEPQMYATIKRGITAKDLYQSLRESIDTDRGEPLGNKVIDFGKQFIAGSTKDGLMDDNFNEYSTGLYRILSGVSDSVGSIFPAMGLSLESKRSVLDIGKNLVLKRALPIYLATQVPGMINAYSEPLLNRGDEENPNNIGKVMVNNVVKPIDTGFHIVKDKLGLTSAAKAIEKWVPGSEQIFELPGVYQLGLTQDEKEREEFMESGMNPIRKGRWWSAGNTPFTGGKIIQFRPNLYRRVEADVNFSDSKYGSRREYYNNTWYPNIINPLAPLNHFVFNRNYYDKKHYMDRPYLQTSPEGSNIPLVGPLFSSTIGRVINPVTNMHPEYWKNNLQPLEGQEKPSTLLTYGTVNPKRIAEQIQQNPYDNNFSSKDLLLDTYNFRRKIDEEQNGLQREIDTRLAKVMISRSIAQTSGFAGQYSQGWKNEFEIYSTPSGSLSIIDIDPAKSLYSVNQTLKKHSVSKIIGTKTRVSPEEISGDGFNLMEQPMYPNIATLNYGLGEQYINSAEVFGLRGFILKDFVTGTPNQNARRIENSGYAYSGNREFWDNNLGGLGGELSEITRRFIQRRNNDTDYVNPIRNTMPSWMPGENYFTNFLTGDPYSKVPNGEERLPGEGYERLWGMKNVMDMRIGSSFIGKGRESIVRHLLHQDVIDSDFGQETVNKGTKLHNAIEKQWLETGLAISTEGKIEDKENKILGFYDAMVVDDTSPTGVGITDIKTTSEKRLKTLRRTQKPLLEHQRQVNYYLWATNNTRSNGYIYYVNKENPDDNLTLKFQYSEKMLQETLTDLKNARNDIHKGIKSGIISRGDLYADIDRYRVLADVAPYSDEFRDMKAKLSWQKLSAKDEEEYKAINERVKAQKEPLRVYPYKFKTSNLQSQRVTVKGIIDNNTLLVDAYGTQHSIKFAGIHVSENDTDKYKDTSHTMNDAASKKIRSLIGPGSRVTISYDADDRNKFSKDSTESIRAVVTTATGVNVNKNLLKSELAKEKEDDNSPAGVNAKYSNLQIKFGSMMETLTHSVISNIPFVGDKFLQVRSPYESYRKNEVYSKSFQSWNHPIRDILRPAIDDWVGNSNPILGVMTAGFIGSMFGKNAFGKLVGSSIAVGTTMIGRTWANFDHEKGRAWRPDRRIKQEEMNEYVDVLKYIKNQRLYETYKRKAKAEDNFDVDSYLESKESTGAYNKLKKQELIDFKKRVKIDFKHRNQYNFKYGQPKYYDPSKNLRTTLGQISKEIQELDKGETILSIPGKIQKMDRKKAVSEINKELGEIEGKRKVTKLPENALKAIAYKQQATNTMYAYEPGDNIANVMSALPKKDRQYFKYFMKAPEEEKEKILAIAPSYLRRVLQTTWGMKVDKKPNLMEYFSEHGLPDQDWVGWNESTDIEDIKVKLVHHNKLDRGEFDIWDDQEESAAKSNIPIPDIHARNTNRMTSLKLQAILGDMGYQDVMVSTNKTDTRFRNYQSKFTIKRDARSEVSDQLQQIEI